MTDHIYNGERGDKVRAKLNEVIDRTHTESGRLDQEIADRIEGDADLQEQIDGLVFDAENDVISVNGKTGHVELDYSDVGAAPEVHDHDSLYAKLVHDHDSLYAKLGHGHDIGEIDGLEDGVVTSIQGSETQKPETGDVTLDYIDVGAAPKTHDHDSLYAEWDHTHDMDDIDDLPEAVDELKDLIGSIATNLAFAGSYEPSTGKVKRAAYSITPEGESPVFEDNTILPDAGNVEAGKFLICVDSGNFPYGSSFGDADYQALLSKQDWIVSDGEFWVAIPYAETNDLLWDNIIDKPNFDELYAPISDSPTGYLNDAQGSIDNDGRTYARQNEEWVSIASVWDSNSNGDIYYNAGNVGIGTDSPDYALLSVEQDDDTKEIARLRIKGKTNNPMLIVTGDEAGNSIDFRATGSTSGSNFTWTTGGQQRMVLEGDGKVGIGTDDPKEQLHVQGEILSTRVNYGNNQNKAYMIAAATNYDGSTTNWGTFGFQHRFKSNSTGGSRITIDTKQGEQWSMQEAGQTTFRNSVRIGFSPTTTSSSSQSLDVDGGVNINGVLLASFATAGTHAFAAGSAAGQADQGDSAVAVGRLAGQTRQGSNSVSVGHQSGQTNQDTNAISVGVFAGQNDQGQYSVAVGREAGRTDQGDSSVAVGNGAGQTDQGGTGIAIGRLAGNASQSLNAVAVGREAGKDNQGQSSVSIGHATGQISQGTSAVAVGYGAGQTDQGDNSIAIGKSAGKTNQAANSICISSSGANDSTSTNPGHIILNSSTGSLKYNGTNAWTFAGGDVSADKFIAGNGNSDQWNNSVKANVPDDYWGGSSGAYMMTSLGMLATQGGGAVDLTSNGYRNKNAKWTALNAQSKPGASQLRLHPNGEIQFNTSANMPDGGAYNLPIRMRIHQDGRVGINGQPGTRVAADYIEQASESIKGWTAAIKTRLDEEPEADKKAVTLEITEDFETLPTKEALAEVMAERAIGGGNAKFQVAGDGYFTGNVSAGDIRVPRASNGSFVGRIGPSASDSGSIVFENTGGNKCSLTLGSDQDATFSGEVSTKSIKLAENGRILRTDSSQMGLYLSQTEILPTNGAGTLIDSGPNLGSDARRFGGVYLDGGACIEPTSYSSNQSGSYLRVEAKKTDGSVGFLFDHKLVSDAGGIASLGTYGDAGQRLYHLDKLGNVEAVGTMKAQDFISTSDERLKTRIAPMPVGLIDDIKPVSWDWIDGGGRSAGVVAQQLQEIGLGDYVHENEEGQLGVNYQALTAILLAEVINLKAEVGALKS